MNSRQNALRIAALASIVAGLLVVLPGTAAAHKKLYGATITAAAQGANTQGKVASAPRCLANRSVSVKNSAGVVQGSTRTDAAGNWSLKTKQLVPGAYTAVLTPRALRRTKSHRHICRGAEASFTVS